MYWKPCWSQRSPATPIGSKEGNLLFFSITEEYFFQLPQSIFLDFSSYIGAIFPALLRETPRRHWRIGMISDWDRSWCSSLWHRIDARGALQAPDSRNFSQIFFSAVTWEIEIQTPKDSPLGVRRAMIAVTATP
jgi:hypothetical protein